jgi:hypothetical protein
VVGVVLMASPVLSEISAAIGVGLESPAFNAVAIVFWMFAWWVVSAISLQWLTPRGLPSVPDDKRWHVRAPTNNSGGRD